MKESDDSFEALQRKEVYELLEGNGPALITHNGIDYGLPYLTGSQLSDLCVEFGAPSVGGSRWCYIESLLQYAIDTNRCDELFQFLFRTENFSNLQNLQSMDEIDEVRNKIIAKAIKQINQYIRLTRKELVLADGHFLIVSNGKMPVLETPKLNVRSIPYVQGLRQRCNADFVSGNFDSVITKSRTTMEEVLVQILEEESVTIVAKGDLIKLYNQVKTIQNMQQTGENDRRINSLLNGLEKIVQSVAEMRNANSDAHGVGSKRIAIRECEARLVMNSAITFCEYIISIHDNK